MRCEKKGHWKKWCLEANQSTYRATEGNSIYFSGLSDLRKIPSSLKEILESKNRDYKSELEHISVKVKLKEKTEFWRNTIKSNNTILKS